jgi:hypothetical protein
MEAPPESALRARVEELSSALDELRRRVALLERSAASGSSEILAMPQARPQAQAGTQPALPALEAPAVAAGAAPAVAPAIAPGVESIEWATGLVPLFGWGLLGIAGAYLLRALTEAGFLPGLLGVGLGIVYALWWLYLAAQRASERPMFSTIHGLTAALIMVPMLWEMTVSFHLISGLAATAVAVCFTLFGLAIGWRRNITAIAWIATLAGLVTTTALFRETHDVTVWVVSILAMAAATEFAACRDHWLGLRWLVALAADFAVLLVTLATALAPPAGVLLGLQLALLTIYLSSTIDRTLLRGLNVTGFEVAQAGVAFAISIGGALHATAAGQTGRWGVGAFCLAAGAVCYIVSFASLENKDGKSRNFYTYSTFAMLLLVTGCFVLLRGATLAAAFSGLAVAALAAELLKDRHTLRLHAGAYLLLAVLSSAMVPRATERIIRTGGGVEAGLPAPYAFALVGAALCYVLLVAQERRRAPRWSDALEMTAVAALAAWGAMGAAAGWMSAAPLRSAMLTAASLGLAWSGRRELRWLAYPLMGLAGLKLIAEDLQQGRSLTLFGSLIFFGGGLILLPRLMRRGAQQGAPKVSPGPVPASCPPDESRTAAC